MTVSFTLAAQPRTQLGTAHSRRLRRLKGGVPTILYGGKEEAPLSLTLDHNTVWHALENPAFYSHILNITVNEMTYQAVLKDLQRHPYKPQVLHLDLLRVTATEKITLLVPLRFVGEAVAPGVKQGGGIVSHVMANVEVSCLAVNLPEFLEVDLSNLALNESITLSQLQTPQGVELVPLMQGDDRTVVTIHLPRTQSESQTGQTTAAGVPAAKTDK